MHGDHFDLVVTQARWLALLGDKAYDLAITAQHAVQHDPPPARLRLLVAVAMGEAEGQERGVLYRRIRAGAGARTRKKHDAHGIICGHIHHAAIHDDFGIRYVNCGDWVESCTAVAEHHDGRLEIIHWIEETPGGGNPGTGRDPGCLTAGTRPSAAG